MTMSEHMIQDYAATSLSLEAHPVSFVREKLKLLHFLSSEEINNSKDGITVKVAGLVLVRQKPGTAGGICFITLEDKIGVFNLVVFKKLFVQYRKEIMMAKLLMVEGRLQREGEVVHVIFRRCFDVTKLFNRMTVANNDNSLSINQVTGTLKEMVGGKVLPGARNFR